MELQEAENSGVYEADTDGGGKGQQVIVLIPEIALTYQTVRRFYGWFGEKSLY